MVKVCFLISGFDYSGAEIVLDRYIDNNISINPYFVIIYDNKEVVNKYRERYGKDKVFLLDVRYNKNALRFIPWIDIIKIEKEFKKIVNLINPEVLYMNNTHEMMLCMNIVKNIGLKSIAHIHDMKKSISSPVKKFLMNKAIEYYNEVITVSKATKKSWENQNIKVVYNGIDEKNFILNIKPIESINTLGFVGKISKRKGIDLLECVFLKLSEKHKNLKLNIAYGSADENCSHILNKLESNKNINLFKGLNQEELDKFYADIDLLVVPSRQDPLPTVIIEAMSQGKLVIGSNIDGIPELLDNEVLLFECDNLNSLENKVLQIAKLDKESLNKYRDDLFTRCNEKFNHQNKVNKINHIINNLVTK